MSTILNEARDKIAAILAEIPTEELPRWVERDGALWFDDRSHGFISSSNPEQMARSKIYTLFDAESAARELTKRGGHA